MMQLLLDLQFIYGFGAGAVAALAAMCLLFIYGDRGWRAFADEMTLPAFCVAIGIGAGFLIWH